MLKFLATVALSAGAVNGVALVNKDAALVVDAPVNATKDLNQFHHGGKKEGTLLHWYFFLMFIFKTHVFSNFVKVDQNHCFL